MEHRLIQGGEQYLPFARSRIKALRATGLKYATQRFIMPGGELVRVQITGEHEYIEISGGGCTLAMESGIVNLQSILEFVPDTYLAGALWETTRVLDYNTPFIALPSPSVWRKNPGETSSGQLSGVITHSGTFKGKVPVDGVRSRAFSPSHELVGDTYAPVSNDGLLRSKKMIAILCPPSIFTGRTRLYVQAMYGLPLYETSEDSSGAVTGPAKLTNIPVQLNYAGTSATPALLLRAYQESSDEATYGPVDLNTSSGVYLDPTTGNHWLFCPVAGSISVYPLISSKCGEALRKYLIPDNPNIPGEHRLTADDREHLEAYILSRSLPWVKMNQPSTLNTLVGTYSMGYGWHWNWTGLVADIVTNETYDQGDGVNYGMRSTHFRMEMAQSDGNWTANITTISGPNVWALSRGSWIIAEPDWTTLGLAKTTPWQSSAWGGSSPFYAFYIGDELKLCTVDVAFRNASPGVRTISDNTFASPGYNNVDVTYTTLGLAGGFFSDTIGNNNYYTAEISVGDVTTGVVPNYTELSESRSVQSTKSNISQSGGFSGGYGDQTLLYGSQPNTQYLYYFGGQIYGKAFTSAYTLTVTNHRHETRGVIIAVVPVYDSQAMYLNQYSSTSDFLLSGFVYYRQGSLYQEESQPLFGATLIPGSNYVYNKFSGPSYDTLIGTTDAVVTTISTESSSGLPICAAGAVTASLIDLQTVFQSEDDGVSDGLYTLSSASTTNPAVLSAKITNVGAPVAPAVSAIVGWA